MSAAPKKLTRSQKRAVAMKALRNIAATVQRYEAMEAIEAREQRQPSDD